MGYLEALCEVVVTPEEMGDDGMEGPLAQYDAEREKEDDMVPLPDQKKVMGPGAVEASWWIAKDETGDMGNIMDRAGTFLDKMFGFFKVSPLEIDSTPTLFEARYEFQVYDKDLSHPEGVIAGTEDCLGFIDLMSGFPMKNTEMMLTIGQYSSRAEITKGVPSDEAAAPTAPIPEDFFEGVDEKRLLLNLLYLDEDRVETMADDLEGEEKPKGLHWWVRINLKGESKWPVPGEFMGLANRAWPSLPWGEQKTSPYLFSGNWMDTVFYTSGIIKEIIEPTEELFCKRYKIQWRKTIDYPEGIVELRPSDFAEYRLGDMVCMLKLNDQEELKESQLWKDDDTKEISSKKFIVFPAIFYGIKGTNEEEEDYEEERS